MSRRRRLLLLCLGVVLAVLGAVALDVSLGLAAVQRVPISPAPEDGRTTWLLVGSDGRERLPAPDRTRYADPAQVEGERADVLVVVQDSPDGPRAVSLPRDLLVGTQRQATDRLTIRLTHGPAALTESVCRDLGIAVDHVVIVDFTAVVALVDAVGGVEVTLAHPVRDPRARLDLPTAGRVRLDGRAALAWVRSRHAEALVDGAWRPVSDPGASRPEHLQEVLSQVAAGLDGPLEAHRALWEVAPRVRADNDLGVAQWIDLLGAVRTTTAHGIRQAPADLRSGAVPVALITAGTRATLDPFTTPSCGSDQG